jgi:D-glycero-D-manno-heptose 1,7-bisphosphate phosphatase
VTKAVFLDRDGVINKNAPEGDYITRWEDFHILPGVAEGISLLNRAGFFVIVVTNQRCIAKGLITEAELQTLHRQMTEFLARGGAIIDDTLYCPHEMESFCECRKPAPGMLLRAARLHGIDLSASWMIGDSDIDIQAGRSAGCKTVRLLTPEVAHSDSGRSAQKTSGVDFVAPSFLNAIRHILQLESLSVSSTGEAPAAT